MKTILTAPWLLPADEAARLETLHHYASPVCLREPVFIGFADLATRIFNLPIASVALVDADEVLYKTNHSSPSLVQQPRVGSICALTIRYNRPIVFTDFTQRVQQNQLTTAALLAAQAYGVQFYASVPLRMPDQRPIGTLCLVGHQPRPFGTEEQQVLEQLARLAEQTLIIRQLCLTTDWLGEEHWTRIQTTLTEDIWELAALVRYLYQRVGSQVPVPTVVLKPVARRLVELCNTFAAHPAGLL